MSLFAVSVRGEVTVEVAIDAESEDEAKHLAEEAWYVATDVLNDELVVDRLTDEGVEEVTVRPFGVVRGVQQTTAYASDDPAADSILKMLEAI